MNDIRALEAEASFSPIERQRGAVARDIPHTIKYSVEQDQVLRDIRRTHRLSYAEIVEQVLTEAFPALYGVVWPLTPRQARKGERETTSTPPKGGAFVYGLLLTADQEVVMAATAQARFGARRRGALPAILEEAFALAIPRLYGTRWPTMKRLLQVAA